LFLAIKALGITGEVVLPSFTFVASANAVVTAGAVPVFADIEYDTCNIDPASVEDRTTPRTEAVMVVHYAGQSCRMDRITAIAEKHGLALIEDSAETIGGEFQERKTGSFGVGCFSFFPTKNITTGEGGMLTTNDAALADKVKALVGHGIFSNTFQREKAERPWFRAATLTGYNFRMSNILGALGVEQLKRIDQMNKARRRHAAYLTGQLKGMPEIDLPVEADGCKHVYQMYTIKVKPPVERNHFVNRLKEEGIGASVHFDPPVHVQPIYRAGGCSGEPLPVTDRVADSIVTLPMYPSLTQGQLDRIVASVKKVIRG
jgi:perosamine synthetase